MAGRVPFSPASAIMKATPDSLPAMPQTDAPPPYTAHSEAATLHPPAARTILIVYFAKEHPLRQTIEQSLYAFDRYTGQRCVYLNLAVRGVPGWLRRLPIDLVVFHTTFLSVRWNPPDFARLLKRSSPLRSLGRARAALPQDEYIHTVALGRFIRDFDITHVFSTVDESQWKHIYPQIDHDRVTFETILTGYLDPGTVRALDRRSCAATERTIDIGYRAKHVPYWLGQHGRLKVEIAERVREAARGTGLTVDISTRAQDTLFGEAWVKFLLTCKYTIGVEGGASLLDPDGSIRARTEAFVAAHPEATFEEASDACFAETDGAFCLRAISPRHLEACATRTCQILIEGDYNGILKPNKDYIPLNRDFSNLDQVLELVQRDDLRERMVERAWRNIVASGRFGYDRFVNDLIVCCLPPDEDAASPSPSALTLYWARLVDRLSWSAVRVRQRIMAFLDALGVKITLKCLFGR